VPNVCVGSREEGRSVLLVSRLSNLARVRRVALDESSRTSTALVKIIFREFLGFEPEWIDAKPDVQRMLAENDAALMIGDPGMIFQREGLTVFDVAGLWREFTDLGFVFAMWAIAPDATLTARSIDFVGARDEGLERITEIIDYYEPLLGLPRDELQTYLQANISFEADAELRAGLDLFYKLAHKHQLVTALKPLQL
jgi:chorismate dehydratase